MTRRRRLYAVTSEGRTTKFQPALEANDVARMDSRSAAVDGVGTSSPVKPSVACWPRSCAHASPVSSMPTTISSGPRTAASVAPPACEESTAADATPGSA